MSGQADPVAMDVVGVRVELPSNQPIVLLKEKDGPRYLPIWIGGDVATAIATAMEGVVPPRPLTHDLMRSVLDSAGVLATQVVVTEMRDSVYFADLTLDVGGRDVHISCRPSDAIALAVRSGTPIFALPGVLAEAGIEFEDEEDDDEVSRFRELLEEVTIEDFLGEGPTS